MVNQSMLCILLLTLCCTLVTGQISDVSGLDWSDMPATLKQPLEQQAAAAAAAADADSEDSQTDHQYQQQIHTPTEIRDFLAAAGFGNIETLHQLLKDGVDINSIEARTGDTALHAATWSNRKKVIEFLLKNDADPNIKNLAGYTPLLLACRKESSESFPIMKVLLMNGAQPWLTNNNGNNALHWSSHLGRKDVTEWLLGEDDLNVDIPNDDGLSALMLAAKSGKDQIIQMLIEQAQASIDMVEPNFGRSVLELASDKGNARYTFLFLLEVWKKVC